MICGEQMDRYDRMSQSILTDEVGIHTGRIGDFRLKTLYRPIYRRCRGHLVPVGVTSSWLPTKAGRPIDRNEFFRTALIKDESEIDRFCSVLALCNLENTGVETLDLHVALDVPDWNDDEQITASVQTVLQWLDASDVSRSRVVTRLAGIDTCGRERLRDHSIRLRDEGLRIDLVAAGAGLPDAAVVEAIQPEIATIDGGFLARIAAVPETGRLFDVLLGQFRQFGTAVHIDNLDFPDRLAAAFDTRADLMQGDLLALPDLAGTCFPTEALSVWDLQNSGDNVAVM